MVRFPEYVRDKDGNIKPIPPRLREIMRRKGWPAEAYNAGLRKTRETLIGSNTLKWAELSKTAPRIPWDIFIAEKFVWRQGEHVALIGPTGQGKTTLLMKILPMHQFVIVFATKPRDTTMDSLVSSGEYVRLEKWEALNPMQFPRRVIWPNARQLNAAGKQREVFHHAFARIYSEGGWTLALDELWYVNKTLKLEMDVKQFLMQGRSLGLSLVAATQRPSGVPVEIYDQSSHLFFWRDNDERNLDRLSGISWRSAKQVRSIIADLETHQVLYINTRSGEMMRTRSPA